MSTSQNLVNQLLAGGMSKAQIARAVGRDSSVISQITSGKKPYANLAPTLAALVQQKAGAPNVQIPQAPRRKTTSGRQAAVRGKTKWAGGRIMRVKRQAVRGGARSIARQLRIAAAAGQRVAFTVTYPRGTKLGKSPKAGGGPSHRASGGEPSVDLGNAGAGFSAQSWVDRVSAAGGDVGQALNQWLTGANVLDNPDTMPIAIEMRTWDAPASAGDGDSDEEEGEGYDPEE